MTIFAIETSCDETAAATVRDGREILGEALASQIPIHRRFGGVVPEVASRAHLEALPRIIERALSGRGWEEIDGVAATAGPGLAGSLLVGFHAAQALAWSKGKPFIPVNHLAGHLYANWLAFPKEDFPFPQLGLIVSGGHTLLVLMEGHHRFRLLGETLDDAAGEAFDKVAALLDLPYPGGPAISELAREGDPARFPLPRAFLYDRGHPYDFSFSGLKTAVRRVISGQELLSGRDRADLAASFEEAVVEVLIRKLERAAREHRPRGILTGGGVIANSRLRARLEEVAARLETPLFAPPPRLCTDNAAVIAAAAHFAPDKKSVLQVDPGLPLA